MENALPLTEPSANRQPHTNDRLQWRWVFLASLTLETPLYILQRHGEMIESDDVHGLHTDTSLRGMPEMTQKVARFASWVVVEEGEQYDAMSSGAVIMDIQDGACEPARYLTFLTRLRSILEGNGVPSAKRQQLFDWLANETWSDIVVCWGGENALIDRLVPSFLQHLGDQGVPGRVIKQLDILGADNRLVLTRLLNGQLGLDITRDIFGAGPQCIERLQMFCISDDMMRQLEKHNETETQSDLASITRFLEDPYIQVAF